MRSPLVTLVTCLAALATTAAPAAATKLTLDSFEPVELAKSWQKPAWPDTQAFCDTFEKKAFPTDVCGNSETGTATLKTKKKYAVRVSGVVGVRGTWANTTCGTPMTLADGALAGTDALFEFANDADAANCYLGTAPVPWGAFLWSVDGGKTWTHPVADGKPKAPAADHTYTFTATGKGKKPLFRWFDVETQDNHGSLTIAYGLKPAKKKA